MFDDSRYEKLDQGENDIMSSKTEVSAAFAEWLQCRFVEWVQSNYAPGVHVDVLMDEFFNQFIMNKKEGLPWDDTKPR
jgi:hypothetical protein